MPIQGIDSLLDKIKSIANGIEDASMQAIEKVGMAHQGAAKMLSASSEVRNSISVSTETTEEGSVSQVYTNLDLGVYQEFGTGPIGEQSGGNGSPHKVTYSKGPWKHEITKGPRAGTHYFSDYWIYANEDGEFFATKGQPAKPYLYPSAMDIKKQAGEITRKALEAFLQKNGG